MQYGARRRRTTACVGRRGPPGTRWSGRAACSTALCGRGLGGLSANLSAAVPRRRLDLWSMRRRDDELWRPSRGRHAPGRPTGTACGSRASCTPNRYTRAAQELFSVRWRRGRRTRRRSGPGPARPAARAPQSFRRVERLVGQYADGWSKRRRACRARFAGLVRLNQAALLAEFYLAADATDLLADLDGVLRGATRAAAVGRTCRSARRTQDRSVASRGGVVRRAADVPAGSPAALHDRAAQARAHAAGGGKHPPSRKGRCGEGPYQGREVRSTPSGRVAAGGDGVSGPIPLKKVRRGEARGRDGRRWRT